MRRWDCAPALGMISLFVMIDTNRKLPLPSAHAWSIDLTKLGGPRFVVLTTSERDARVRLVEHLDDLGKISAAPRSIAAIPAERVTVIW